MVFEVEVRNVAGEATRDRLEALIKRVDEIAEILNSLRRGTAVRLGGVRVQSSR